ncbi:hypothetical protein V5O48_011528 [Marasmius crinis-equi]|uniref:Coenzyme Q-binding protein COQ10 START domain-containing protein n=1 Tax=Marasmius crinis-equi TaxID=585013 RepID=A0ABR3F5C0_9AGAR
MKHYQSTTTPLLTIFATLVAAQNPPSHLPPASPGVFNPNASILINAPIDKVWDAVLNFTAYPEWNPFVRLVKQSTRWLVVLIFNLFRSLMVTDAFGLPLADQTAREGAYIIINSQVPPIEGPVNASTTSNPLHTKIDRDMIIHVDTPEKYQAAWKFAGAPESVLSAEYWSAVSEVVSGSETLTFYESREVFNGAIAKFVKETYGSGVQKGFEAQATALKARVEGQLQSK